MLILGVYEPGGGTNRLSSTASNLLPFSVVNVGYEKVGDITVFIFETTYYPVLLIDVFGSYAPGPGTNL